MSIMKRIACRGMVFALFLQGFACQNKSQTSVNFAVNATDTDSRTDICGLATDSRSGKSGLNLNESRAMCVGNTTSANTPSTQYALESAATCICQFLANNTAADNTEVLTRQLATEDISVIRNFFTRGDKGHIFYYTGHGRMAQSSDGQLNATADAYKKNQKFGFLFTQRETGIPEWRPFSDIQPVVNDDKNSGGWNVLIFNACHSGFVDIHNHKPATSVIASSFNAVTTSNYYNLALAKGLLHADEPPIGNCDGAVTDAELVDYINATLAGQNAVILSGTRKPPSAILLQQANADLPIVWTEETSRQTCKDSPSATGLLTEDWVVELLDSDTDLKTNLKDHAMFVDSRGSRGRLVESDYTYLAYNGVEFKPATIIKIFSEHLNLKFLDLDKQYIERARQLGKVATFTHVYILKTETPQEGKPQWIELEDARSEDILMGRYFIRDPDNSNQIAYGILRGLTLPVSLYSVPSKDGLMHVIKFSGRVPSQTRTVFAVPWHDLTEQRTASQKKLSIPDDIFSAVPCEEGRGQCFSFLFDSKDLPADDWIVLLKEFIPGGERD